MAIWKPEHVLSPLQLEKFVPHPCVLPAHSHCVHVSEPSGPNTLSHEHVVPRHPEIPSTHSRHVSLTPSTRATHSEMHAAASLAPHGCPLLGEHGERQ